MTPKTKANFDKEILLRLKNYILKRVGSKEEGEEIFQETLVSATYSLPLFRGQSSFFSWLCGIANHEISDFYRKKKIKTFLFSRLPFLENLASEALTPEEKIEKEELKREIKIVLSLLSEGYKEVLRLKYIEGLTIGEIAQKLKISFKAVESKLTRARQSFRKIWLAKGKNKDGKKLKA